MYVNIFCAVLYGMDGVSMFKHNEGELWMDDSYNRCGAVPGWAVAV